MGVKQTGVYYYSRDVAIVGAYNISLVAYITYQLG